MRLFIGIFLHRSISFFFVDSKFYMLNTFESEGTCRPIEVFDFAKCPNDGAFSLTWWPFDTVGQAKETYLRSLPILFFLEKRGFY